MHQSKTRSLVSYLKYKLRVFKLGPVEQVAGGELDVSQESDDSEQRMQIMVRIGGKLKIRDFSSLKTL